MTDEREPRETCGRIEREARAPMCGIDGCPLPRPGSADHVRRVEPAVKEEARDA